MYDIFTKDGSQDSSQWKGGEWKKPEYRLTKEQKEAEDKLIRGKKTNFLCKITPYNIIW